ncbi:hypothetical protein ASG73_08620 [Janibacter sp. Soil728]|uniref:DUF2505 domain-containing protein n=1 Tax=Janibacter sp. Soil728 TaxID=1736393 RepID=UPI0007019840|nr:DUF2505 domain-containing protein [Janibacter sp. Soil728]KRE37701.1 hypothetical protein ASG73_08620 [Janibacter sp. Soil728]
MKITRSAPLPATVEDAFAIISTQEYQQAKVEAQASRASATVSDHAGSTVVRSERHVPTAGMPRPVVSMVGDTLSITERQTWHPAREDGTRHGDLALSVAGVPLKLVGTIVLSPTAGGSSLAIDADLSCSIPIFGKKIEEAARPAIEESIDHEISQLNARLA